MLKNTDVSELQLNQVIKFTRNALFIRADNKTPNEDINEINGAEPKIIEVCSGDVGVVDSRVSFQMGDISELKNVDVIHVPSDPGMLDSSCNLQKAQKIKSETVFAWKIRFPKLENIAIWVHQVPHKNDYCVAGQCFVLSEKEFNDLDEKLAEHDNDLFVISNLSLVN